MKNRLAHLIQLGLAIVVMCTSGALGRYIDLPPPVIIWFRCVLGALALYVVLKWSKRSAFLGWGRHFRIVLISGLFLGVHWITYFYALHWSTVAIGMLSLFTYPLMTTLLEPIILKTPFERSNLLLALVALVGVAFLVPELSFSNEYTLGVSMGLVSALFYSLRNILLKKNISEHSGITLMYYQLVVLSLLLWPVIFIFDLTWSDELFADWEAILMLGLFTTALGHTLFVLSFRHFTISTVSIMSSFTPLMGTAVGYILLDEVPAGKTMIGGGLICLTVLYESIRSVRKS